MMFAALALALASPSPLPEKTKADIQRLAETKLLDGRSARFIWPDKRDPVTYCGFVNAKNSLGAYTGYKPFFVMLNGKPSSFTVLEYGAGSSRTMVDLFTDACRDSGYPLTP